MTSAWARVLLTGLVGVAAGALVAAAVGGIIGAGRQSAPHATADAAHGQTTSTASQEDVLAHTEAYLAAIEPMAHEVGRLVEQVLKAAVRVLAAVRDAPPPSFRGGGKWEAMHDDMAGFYEVRVRHGQTLHRLFCVLDRSTDTPTLLVITGASKPNRQPMPQAVYDEAKRLREVFQAHVADGEPNNVVSC